MGLPAPTQALLSPCKGVTSLQLRGSLKISSWSSLTSNSPTHPQSKQKQGCFCIPTPAMLTRTECSPGASHLLISLTLPSTLGGRGCYPHLTDEESEAQKGHKTCPGAPSSGMSPGWPPPASPMCHPYAEGVLCRVPLQSPPWENASVSLVCGQTACRHKAGCRSWHLQSTGVRWPTPGSGLASRLATGCQPSCACLIPEYRLLS